MKPIIENIKDRTIVCEYINRVVAHMNDGIKDSKKDTVNFGPTALALQASTLLALRQMLCGVPAPRPPRKGKKK